IELLRKVGELLEENHYVVENIDATIIAQKPKLMPYLPAMRQNVADTLQLELNQVSIKATTEEGLGFTGAGQGIAAQAICCLVPLLDLFEHDVMMGYPDEGGCKACPGCGFQGNTGTT
ncbi:2-C-methyl-D-erythritol 2,4-cyclodiphosphate synthase, partial [Vibrio sp. FNV 38]|nr:2-C-methyl-D-erythritol 2,4-cyclodiphosphate synthase [Vibrio sp. FNV 38]